MTTKPTMTLTQIDQRFSTEEACKQFLKRRWPNGVQCPRCHNAKVYALKSARFTGSARRRVRRPEWLSLSVIAKTIFENTNYPLSTWFQVIYLMTQSKKGISALQIHRQIGSGDYRTAWYMCHRIRAAMKEAEICQADG